MQLTPPPLHTNSLLVPPSSSNDTMNEQRPKKDNAHQFKKKFNKLLLQDKKGAAKKWATYKETRKCGSVRPCVRIYFNFCIEQGGEYEMMSGNRLGSRHCSCPLVMENVPV